MSQSNIDVAIIGAGPYGLSMASQLSERRINRRIFGVPMQSWRQMPPGLYLKSFGFATSIPTPRPNYTLPEYCRSRGLEDLEPILTSTFADYGEWFQQQLVPDLERIHVSKLDHVEGGFDLTLETGESLRAKRVIVATGLGYFTRVPDAFASLSPDRVTHAWNTSAYLKTGQFVGKDVTVIGSGQSALEAAALLHEGGASVRIVCRQDVWWSDKLGERSLFEKLKNPNTVVGPGRLNWVIEHFPWLPYHLPTERRVRFTRRHLGPFGAWWLRDRVEGKVPILNHTSIGGATMANGRIRLTIKPAGGGEQTVETDHILSGTGYEADVDRLPYFTKGLAARVARVERAPKLTTHFESSVHGLYFVGPQAAFSFGPLVRFVAGAPFTTPRVAQHVARSL